jgi:hypothetical protein
MSTVAETVTSFEVKFLIELNYNSESRFLHIINNLQKTFEVLCLSFLSEFFWLA